MFISVFIIFFYLSSTLPITHLCKYRWKQKKKPETEENSPKEPMCSGYSLKGNCDFVQEESI